DGRPAEYTHVIAAAGARAGTPLLTGGYVNGSGYLQVWDDAAGQAPRAKTLLPLSPPKGVGYTLPRAICFVSSGDARGLDHAAVVLRSPARRGAGQEYRLALLDLKTFRLVQQP